MADDHEQIRDLIERWAAAVHTGDLAAVTADHADDIVMFDVPPPYEGVRGIDAYREVWSPFFQWQAQGAVFEIESLEVTAGEDVAFAHALLRCGTEREFAENPPNRLRLTLGLRKQDGRWTVAHEHHSFPDAAPDTATGEHEVRALHERWFADTEAKDLDGIMAPIADDVVSYEHEEPLQYAGAAQMRDICEQGMNTSPETVTWDVPDLKVLVRGDLAVAWGLNRMQAGQADESWSRGTRVFQRGDDGWKMIHQHVSYPYDPETGEAKTDLRP
ncbi:YybH family protein [Actinomadura hibisca]|uniref:YybH family protein n=1 Tax=Actinomadura hibisca TaxID=68565 RepID=UPI00082CE700|nr:SgcJ/EcaC family oxidoreductase [Actinomadura hibisca]